MDSTEEDLIRPIFKNGRYQNPFDTWEDTPGMGTFLKLMRSEDHSNIPSPRVRLIKKPNHEPKSLQEQNMNFSTDIDSNRMSLLNILNFINFFCVENYHMKACTKLKCSILFYLKNLFFFICFITGIGQDSPRRDP